MVESLTVDNELTRKAMPLGPREMITAAMLEHPTELIGKLLNLLNQKGILTKDNLIQLLEKSSIATDYVSESQHVRSQFVHREFVGSANWSPEDRSWYGKVLNTKALITYEATTLDSLLLEFRQAVDDYIIFYGKEEAFGSITELKLDTLDPTSE